MEGFTTVIRERIAETSENLLRRSQELSTVPRTPETCYEDPHKTPTDSYFWNKEEKLGKFRNSEGLLRAKKFAFFNPSTRSEQEKVGGGRERLGRVCPFPSPVRCLPKKGLPAYFLLLILKNCVMHRDKASEVFKSPSDFPLLLKRANAYLLLFFLFMCSTIPCKEFIPVTLRKSA